MEISEMLRQGIIGKDVVDGRSKARTSEVEHATNEGKGAVLVLADGSASGGDSERKRKAVSSKKHIHTSTISTIPESCSTGGENICI
ncbi:hypothetical protein Taro_036213 [Colocasia esculenta]|uniref:Uncharacterized protein n=1 Tax=Colocasia esculenta TaxID=4460 RepID=A0A843VWT3_COLES|nr:hypothetical protein [Colocasia esculenta]